MPHRAAQLHKQKMEELKKLLSEHLRAFIVAAVIIGGPATAFYVSTQNQYTKLQEDRHAFDEKRAKDLLDIEKERLQIEKAKFEVEKLQLQLATATDSVKQMMEQVHQQSLKNSAESQQLQAAWNNIDLWRKQLDPTQEYKKLADEFTNLSVDFKRCYQPEEHQRYVRAQLLAKRIWFVAAQTNSTENMSFARAIQPTTEPSGCVRIQRMQ